MACTPTPSYFVWEMGLWATWSRSGGGEATILGARGSWLLMVAEGPKESWIPSSPVRMQAQSGRRA